MKSARGGGRWLWADAQRHWRRQDEMIAARGWPTPREFHVAVVKGGLHISLLIALVHFLAPLYMRAERARSTGMLITETLSSLPSPRTSDMSGRRRSSTSSREWNGPITKPRPTT